MSYTLKPSLTRHFLLALGISASLSSLSAQAQQMVSISNPTVNMRSGPGTNHSVEWALSKGYPLKVLKRQGQWLQVSDFENDRGWVHRPLTSSAAHHVVRVKVANLRQQPSVRSRILDKLEYGEVVRTLSKRPDWVKVQRPGGQAGWVSRKLLWGW